MFLNSASILRCAFVATALAAALCGCHSDSPPREITITIADRPFRLELAVTSDQISKGMMGRTEVADSAGMLFLFPDEKPRNFWMKGCLVPLDALFLDAKGRIVSIQRMAVPDVAQAEHPPSYPSRWPAKYVIELRGGRAAELGLEPGRVLSLPLRRLESWVK